MTVKSRSALCMTFNSLGCPQHVSRRLRKISPSGIHGRVCGECRFENTSLQETREGRFPVAKENTI